MQVQKKIVAINISAWVLYLFISIGVYINLLSTDYAIIRGIVNVLPLAALYYANVFLMNKFYEKKKQLHYFLLAFSLFVILVLLRTFFNLYLKTFYPTQNIGAEVKAIVALIFLTSAGVQIMSSLIVLLQNRSKRERNNLAQLNQLQSNQIKYLKAQINPHFLFNSLNNIYSLVLTKSNDAPKMLLQLSDILRYSLYTSENQLTSVENEINQIKKYIALYRLKTNKNLNIQLTCAALSMDVQIPPMLLLTLIENSFKHGDLMINKDGYVDIKSEMRDNMFIFTCSNSYSSLTEKDAGGGLGLANIRQSLNILYPNNSQLLIEDNKNEFTVIFKLNL